MWTRYFKSIMLLVFEESRIVCEISPPNYRFDALCLFENQKPYYKHFCSSFIKKLISGFVLWCQHFPYLCILASLFAWYLLKLLCISFSCSKREVNKTVLKVPRLEQKVNFSFSFYDFLELLSDSCSLLVKIVWNVIPVI